MLDLTLNAQQILRERYLLKNKKGILETPEELFQRVARFLSSCEDDKAHYAQQFYNLMTGLKFLPNSPTLMNAGCENGQLSACFALPVEDSLESIFSTLKNTALLHQSGGGTGFNFSRLQSKAHKTGQANGTASGPVSVIKMYDEVTACVKQGGKRRGANMAVLNVDHPDIEEFIQSKHPKNTMENFNISVGVSDKFMESLIHNRDWQLIDPHTKKVVKTLSATSLWNQLVEEAWYSGDPGLVFLDTLNRANPTPSRGEIKATNPCGEVPLLDYESCNLGSVNLSKMLVKEGRHYRIDWEELSETIKLAIRFLDNVITLNHYLLPETKAITLSNRKIGLGVMGWAELLIRLEIPYASRRAVLLGEKLMGFIQKESYRCSQELAAERGTFPEWSNSIYFPETLMRNATCNSIAPTGTISVIANTSYSIEPLFALAYKRVGILGTKVQVEINSGFVERMKDLGLWNEALKNEVFQTGSLGKMRFLPKTERDLFKIGLEIPWHYHLQHQSAFQKYTDNAVSKTINLPKNTRKKTVSRIFMTAWKYKLKGITIYRYGSKNNQILQKCNLNTGTSC